MRKIYTVVLISLLATGCSKKDNKPNGSMTAEINNVPFTAKNVFAEVSLGSCSFTGENDSIKINVVITPYANSATDYTVSTAASIANNCNADCVVGPVDNIGMGGHVKVVNNGVSRIEGTFEFTTSAQTITNGQFRISY